MIKTLGIFLNNKGTSNVDVSHLELGNPGMGGTQFEFFILLSELKKKKLFRIIYFGTAIQRGLNGIETIVVRDIYEAFEKCNDLGVDILITRDGGHDKLDALLRTKVIYWVHNFIPFEFCKVVGKSDIVKRVVFVSYQHRDFYHEMNIAKKAEVIFNAFYLPTKIEVISDKQNDVVFVGNIVPIKKLHVVTSIWPNIVRKVPDAKLLVIGTGKTANREKTLGPFGIAEESYEKKLLEPLIKTNTLNSVKFLGVLGSEKNEIIRKSKVAIAPNDKETFCISALEYNLSGVPVIGVSKGGINDVVINKKTGQLYKTYKGIEKGVISVLLGKKEFNELPNGLDYFNQNFNVPNFVDKWVELIQEVDRDEKPRKIKPRRPYGDKFKWVGFIFKGLRSIFRLPDGFSRVGIISKLSKWRRHG